MLILPADEKKRKKKKKKATNHKNHIHLTPNQNLFSRGIFPFNTTTAPSRRDNSTGMFRSAAVVGRAILRPRLHGWEGFGLLAAAAVRKQALVRFSSTPKQRRVLRPRGFRSWVLRWGLAVGGVYYYMTGGVFAGHHGTGIKAPCFSDEGTCMGIGTYLFPCQTSMPLPLLVVKMVKRRTRMPSSPTPRRP